MEKLAGGLCLVQADISVLATLCMYASLTPLLASFSPHVPRDNQCLDILFSLVVLKAAHKLLTVGAPSCHHSLLCCVMFT